MATVHVVPVDDLIQHIAPPDPSADTGAWLCVEELASDSLEDCPCGPLTIPITAEDGSLGWLVTHHSLDGRELREVADA